MIRWLSWWIPWIKLANDDLRPEKQGFFARTFNRVQKSVYEMTAKYQQIGAQVDNVAAFGSPQGFIVSYW